MLSQMKDQLESCLSQIKNRSLGAFDLVSGTDLLDPVHLTHPGELDEALVVKVILDAQVVAVSEMRNGKDEYMIHDSAGLLLLVIALLLH